MTSLQLTFLVSFSFQMSVPISFNRDHLKSRTDEQVLKQLSNFQIAKQHNHQHAYHVLVKKLCERTIFNKYLNQLPPKSKFTGIANWKEHEKKGENSIPKLLSNLELNKLTEERQKITPSVLKKTQTNNSKLILEDLDFFWP